ncbi:MAG: LacI family DNA-binding transcriptional regulator [Acidimicrobiales bacterium]|jgi:LacI family transcriptional regulator
MATTIFDVARKSGVSTATVSRVLNGNMHVAPELAAKVMGAARELNYRPNRVARSLRLRHNRVLALVISDVRTGPFFADVVRGVEDGAHAAGYPMFLCNADEDPEKEAGYLHLAIAENVAGVILTPSGPGTDLRPLFDAGIQVVLADRKLPGNQADTVVGDNLSGATEAVSHLIANGYRRIACITGPLAATTSAERLLGYRMALQQAGITLDDSLVCVADFREAGGHHAMQELLRQKRPPEAVFIANNRMAAGALQAIDEAQKTIPDDIAVVGFDEMSWAPLLRTALTTVSQPAYDLGYESAIMLLNRLNGYSGSVKTVVLPTQLNVRASSAPRSGPPPKGGSAAGPRPARELAHPPIRPDRSARKRS